MPIYESVIRMNRPDFLGGGTWEISSLNEVTVLFGRNGSGKSLLLRMLRDSRRDETHYVSPERAGDITFELGLLNHQYTGSGRSQRRADNRGNEFRQESFTRVAAILMRIGNLAGRRAEIGVDLRDIERAMNELLPDFEFRISGEQPPHYTLTRVNPTARVTSVSVLSSGEAEILSIGLDMLTVCTLWKLEQPGTRLLLLDEPDLHLHPDLQQGLARFIVQLVKNYPVQVVVTTHSVALMSALARYGGQQASLVYFGRTNPQLRASRFDDAVQQVASCLGGHALMGPLFGLPLLIVEGDDDYKIWSAVPRGTGGAKPFAVIPGGGKPECKKLARTLRKVLEAVGEEGDRVLAFVLLDLDEDEGMRMDSGPVRLLTLNCRESENLYVTDQVLSQLGTTWDDAKAAILRDADNYGEKASLLRSIANGDRRTADIKRVIYQLVQILDPKTVDWALRVGRCIGASVPCGQLADFLGDELVSILWPPSPASPSSAAS